MRVPFLPAIALAAAACALGQSSDLLSLSSPNGQIQFQLFLSQQPDPSEPYNRLAYQVSFKGKELIDTSFMGLNIVDQPILGVNVGLETSKTAAVDQTYTVPAGKSRSIRDHYNSLTAQYLQNGTLGRRITVEVRAYDDGVAFRYVVPWSNPLVDMQIVDEFTEFQFAQDAETYPLILKDFQTPYEDQYNRNTLSGIHSDSLIALPFLVEQPGVGWVAVTEADIDNYAGMYLQHQDGRIMISTLAPRVDDNTIAVHTSAPMTCPWRVLLIGAEPGRLIESNIVSNLNPPSAIADTSWIKPGKTAWNWWSGTQADGVDFQPGMNTATIKHYIDFAADSKLEYMLIDAGWAAPGEGALPPDITRAIPAAIPAIDMPEILRYAKSKGVGVWLGAHWTSVQRQMEEAFALYEKWGVAGVEIDGMNRDDQWMVDFYRRMAKTAAGHHLMVDFHGAYKPDGMSRTWPNVISREAVMGLEYLKWSARTTPDHDVMLAFTRMLAGPMDYTPGGFDNVIPAEFQPRNNKPMVMGTRAHQLALYVVFDSPLMMVSDYPEAYKGQQDFEFIKEVPSSWDETHVVTGRVGEFVTLARKKGNEWYLGGITNWDSREVNLPLEFLGSGEYVAEIYSDAPDADVNPKHTTIEQRRVTASTLLKVNLAPGGGVAVRFVPAK
jgi:alpha-glucosidase